MGTLALGKETLGHQNETGHLSFAQAQWTAFKASGRLSKEVNHKQSTAQHCAMRPAR